MLFTVSHFSRNSRMRYTSLLLFSVLAIVASVFSVNTDKLIFAETFDIDPFLSGKWTKSSDPKYVDDASNPAIKIGPSSIPAKGSEKDNGLRLTKESKHYGFGSKLRDPISFKDNTELVFQYELKLEEQLNCGGAYIKLLRDSPGFDLSKLNGETPYSIMFGPDKCGSNNKIHFIFPHENPLTHVWEEKHLNDTAAIKGDKKTHLYTLSLKDDNSFAVYIDKTLSKKGSLLTHMKPAINPPAEIDDPTDFKPEDWVDEAQINDPAAFKPDDWDETAPKMIPNPDAVKPDGWLDDGPATIPDPNAVKPDDWDDEQDGLWEAPQINNPDCDKFGCGEWKRPMMKNPAYKGIWKAPRIPNPAYKGPWKARQIPNPDKFEDLTPAKGMQPIAALAVEVWTINGGLHFDNFIIARSLQDAWAFADETFTPKQSAELSKEKKEKKESIQANRNELRNSGNFKDRLVAVLYDVFDFVQDNLEANFNAVVGSAAGFVIVVVYLCWPSQKKSSRKASNPSSVATSSASTQEDSANQETMATSENSADADKDSDTTKKD